MALSNGIFLIVIDYWRPNQPIVWTCPTCGKHYKHRQSLRNHKKFQCGVDKKFQCHICEKLFRQKGNLNLHLGIVHKTYPYIKY